MKNKFNKVSYKLIGLLIIYSLLFSMCKSRVVNNEENSFIKENIVSTKIIDNDSLHKVKLANITSIPFLGTRTNFGVSANFVPNVLGTISTSKIMNDAKNSQFIKIDATKNNVVEGKNGTILVCPKNCFVNANGDIVNENIMIELKEAFSLSDMLLNNLSTTSNGNLLETDGMIYINPTANDQQLFINKNIPIHIEMPTKKKLVGMSVYKGVQEVNENINWIDPMPLENYLQIVDFSLLDFLPKGFSNEIEKNIPFKNYNIATPQLIDSLYYSLSVYNGRELTKGLQSTNVNEAYYNKNYKVVNGKYDSKSFELKVNDSIAPTMYDVDVNKGIDPAIIKLKTKAYQKTFLATKEFEKRMPAIFKTCNNEVIKFYVKNTGKNLYEADKVVANMLNGTASQKDFEAFSQLKETNVEDRNAYVDLLQNYYEKQLTAIKKELEVTKQKLVATLQKQNEAFKVVKEEYQNLLWKREKFRMEKYGFNWTAIGWINIDRGTIPKTWRPQRLEVHINSTDTFTQMYSYVVYTSIKSIYRLNTTDYKNFYVGNIDDKQMLMPKHQLAYSITIGYKNEVPYFYSKEFETGNEPVLFAKPSATTKQNIAAILATYDNYAPENKISTDLEYMQKFYVEKLRQKDLQSQQQFIYALWHLAYPCKQDIAEKE
jgi:hypothetical protein